MNTRRIPASEPNNDGFTSTNLRLDLRQQAGPWREFILWLLLTAFLLMLLADAAYAAEQRTSPRTRSADAGVPTYNIDAICRGAASRSFAGNDRARECTELQGRRAQRPRAAREAMVAIRYGRPQHM